MGVPPEMDVYFHRRPTRRRARCLEYQRTSARAFCSRATSRRCARLVDGGEIHSRRERRRHSFTAPAASQRLRYVFLTPGRRSSSCASSQRRGVEVTAQDVPGARPVPLERRCSQGRARQ